MDIDFKRGGVLYVRYGTMNSDKTTQLLANIQSLGHSSASNAFMVFINSRDSRGGNKRISAANGLRHDEVFVCDAENPSGIHDIIRVRETKTSTAQKILLFDEFNLYDESFVKEVLKLIKEGRTVAVYGLHTDFRGENFKTAERLLSLAHRMETTHGMKLVFESKAYCKVVENDRQCEDSASYNARLVKGNGSSDGEVSFVDYDSSIVSGFVRAPYYDPTIVVEGSSSRIKYTTTCRKHFGVLPGKDLIDKIKEKLKTNIERYSSIIEGDVRAIDAVAFLVEEGYVNIVGGYYSSSKTRNYTEHDISELVRISKLRDSNDSNSAVLSVLGKIKNKRNIPRGKLIEIYKKTKGIERIIGDLTKSGFVSLHDATIKPRMYARF